MDKYSFNFIDHKTVEIIFKSTGKNPENIEIKPRFEFSHEKKEKQLKVHLGISFNNEDAPFIFKINTVGLFEFDQDITNEDVESIANVNCAAILYPFLREILADTTRRAGFPPLLLPSINFVNLNKKLKKEIDLEETE